MLKVNTACIDGMGSSLILKMTMEKALKELGIDAQVTYMDTRQSENRHLPDVYIITPSLARTIGGQEEMTLITTRNFTDVKTVREEIQEALDIEEQ